LPILILLQHTHTLRLSSNNLKNLATLAGLPKWLPHIRALDLSDNPELQKLGMLDVLSTLSCLTSSKDNGVKVGPFETRFGPWLMDSSWGFII
jgi:Leucine-rich repeat (LRR) protein